MRNLVILRYCEGSARPYAQARSFGIPQDDIFSAQDRPADLNRLESGFDFLAARFEERRQCEPFAESLHRFVGVEAGAVGGELEKDPAGFAEVETSEIEAVYGPAGADVQLLKALEPLIV